MSAMYHATPASVDARTDTPHVLDAPPYMLSSRSSQDVYARHFVSGRGYPLWTPEPSMSLPRIYVREGFRIGDVGIVTPEDGSFEVLFNVCLPPTHILHRKYGVPNNFTTIPLSGRDIFKYADAEEVGHIISSSAMGPMVGATNSASDHSNEYPTRNEQPGVPNYEPVLSSQERAVLILPEGAERYDLRNKHLPRFLDEVLRHAVDWYTYAEQRLGRIIDLESLYLVTGFYKACSWSLATCRQTQGNDPCDVLAQFKSSRVGGGSIPANNTTQGIDWRAGPSDEYYSGMPNQTVFVRGFKIAIREGTLSRGSDKGGSPSVRSDSIEFTTCSRSMDGTSVGRGHLGTNTRRGSVNTSGGNMLGAKKDDIHKDIVIHPFRQVTKPFHPSDIINRYLLRVVPSANVAITHDSQWAMLLEKGHLSPGETSQEDYLIAAMISKYSMVLLAPQAAVYFEHIATKDGTDVHHHPTSAETINVILFGETGVGKSAVVNLIAQRKVAEVSSSPEPCTTQPTRHNISFDGLNFSIFEAVGFNGSPFQDNSHLKAIERAYDFVLELSNAGGIHLLLCCMSATFRITSDTQNLHRLFYHHFFQEKVPVVVVTTGLEWEADMEKWWERNSVLIDDCGIKNVGHACITTLANHTHKYTESQDVIRKVLKDCHLKDAFPLDVTDGLAKAIAGMERLTDGKIPTKWETMDILSKHIHLAPSSIKKVMDRM